MTINWYDPEARLRLIGTIGHEAFQVAFAEHLRETQIAVVNGHAIRPVGTRYGTLYQVGSTGNAFSTPEQAFKFAETTPPTGT